MMAEDKARTGRQDGDVVGQVAAFGWSGGAQRWMAGVPRAGCRRAPDPTPASRQGLALTEAAEVEEGMRRLDAAAAAATSCDVADLMWIGKVCCWLIIACRPRLPGKPFADVRGGPWRRTGASRC
jgi:hypothetical protein